MIWQICAALLPVAEAGAITEAARRLGLTQPALTRRLQQLESEFGTTLLQRSRNGATLTEAGSLLVGEARQLIERYEGAKREVARHTAATGGTIRFGGGAPRAVSFLLPGEIARFQTHSPNVHFQVKEGSSSDIAEDVASGRLELGLVTLPIRKRASPSRRSWTIRSSSLPPRAIPSPVLAGSPEAIDGENFVGFEGGSAIRQIVDDSLRQAGVEINVVMELRSIPAILRMVATTKSLAFVSRLGVQGQDLVQEVPVVGRRISRKLALAERKRTHAFPRGPKLSKPAPSGSQLEAAAAAPAIARLRAIHGARAAIAATKEPAPLAQGLIELNGHDARGHGNDGVACNHGAGGDGLTQTRLRDKIPIAHGGEGHNGPVHGDGNAREAMLGPLNDVQQRGKDRNQGQNRAERRRSSATHRGGQRSVDAILPASEPCAGRGRCAARGATAPPACTPSPGQTG